MQQHRRQPALVMAESSETPMQRAARERAEDAARAERLAAQRAPDTKPPSLFGLSAPQSCETSFDCEQPLVCCDLLFTSVCCAGGMGIPIVDGAYRAQAQLQAIPIPVEKGDRPPSPGGPPAGGWGY